MTPTKSKPIDLSNEWRVHTPNLFAEILTNPGTHVLRAPLEIFGGLLSRVAERANELNDPKLTELMFRLTLYEVSDPEHKKYNEKITQKYLHPKKVNHLIKKLEEKP